MQAPEARTCFSLPGATRPDIPHKERRCISAAVLSALPAPCLSYYTIRVSLPVMYKRPQKKKAPRRRAPIKRPQQRVEQYFTTRRYAQQVIRPPYPILPSIHRNKGPFTELSIVCLSVSFSYLLLYPAQGSRSWVIYCTSLIRNSRTSIASIPIREIRVLKIPAAENLIR
jgi:hypothetical protein